MTEKEENGGKGFAKIIPNALLVGNQLKHNSDEELKIYVQLSSTVSHQLPYDQWVHAHWSGL